jgi:FkbM family methyltransferase
MKRIVRPVGRYFLAAARRAVAPFGYQIVRPVVAEQPPNWPQSFRILRRYGLEPRTVLDIGVAYGTPELYRQFPAAHFLLFEPTVEARPAMEEIAAQYRATLFHLALGSSDGELTLHVRRDLEGSSLLEEVSEVDIATEYAVPVRRLDGLVDTVERPALAKIDVQGYEMEVLKGMVGLLPQIDAVLVEVSTIAALKGGAEVREVFAFFTDRGWSLAEVAGLSRRPLDGALAQMDLLFVPDSSPIRADRRWWPSPPTAPEAVGEKAKPAL